MVGSSSLEIVADLIVADRAASRNLPDRRRRRLSPEVGDQ